MGWASLPLTRFDSKTEMVEEIESRKAPNRTMKRLLQITPEASHVIVNEEKSNLIEACSPI